MAVTVHNDSGKSIATGTGFFIAPDGKLVTTRHGVKEGKQIVATASDGKQYSCSGFLVEDAQHDLVVLKINGDGFPILPIDSTASVASEQRIVVIHSPFMGQNVVTGRVVRRFNVADDYQWLKIDMPAVRGQSGAPVLNEKGSVIGVVAGVFADEEHKGFAIPAEVIGRLGRSAAAATQIRPIEELKRNTEDELLLDEDFRAALSASLQHDYVEAKRRMALASKRFPRSAACQLLLGSYCAALKEHDEACAAYRKAVELKPEYSLAWAYLSGVLGLQGKYTEAIAAGRKAAELNPDSVSAWMNLGAIAAASGHFDLAYQIVERVSQLDKSSGEKLKSTVEMLSRLKQKRTHESP